MKRIRLIEGIMMLLMLSFIYSCTNDDENPGQGADDQKAYDAADAIKGGQLFDKFWATDFYTGPVDSSVKEADIEDYPDFYRCKQCHGWDLKGNAGWYINRAPKTTRPDVSNVDMWEVRANDGIREIFDNIKNKTGAIDPARTADGTDPSLGGNEMPAYGKIFTDAQIWDLVKFIKEGAIDNSQLYDLATSGTYPTGTKTMTNLGKDGDAAAGDAYYAANCKSCHGADGKGVKIDGTLSLGAFTREGPHEAQHKFKNGQPGFSGMPGWPDATTADVKNLLKTLSDDVKYPAL